MEKYKPKLNALELGHLGNIRWTELGHHTPNYRKYLTTVIVPYKTVIRLSITGDYAKGI